MTKDHKQAMEWCQKAVKAGSAAAMVDIALMYESGVGVEKDYKEAAKWYRKAAEGGNTVAMVGLGGLLKSGRGVEKDEKEAVRWFRKAAELGDAGAMNRLMTRGTFRRDVIGKYASNRNPRYGLVLAEGCTK